VWVLNNHPLLSFVDHELRETWRHSRRVGDTPSTLAIRDIPASFLRI
jgi:hypothetical protein